jgi:hypothetical protein
LQFQLPSVNQSENIVQYKRIPIYWLIDIMRENHIHITFIMVCCYNSPIIVGNVPNL